VVGDTIQINPIPVSSIEQQPSYRKEKFDAMRCEASDDETPAKLEGRKQTPLLAAATTTGSYQPQTSARSR
jgi:hypothetical protein